MKKVLFATTALVATAGFAAAEMSLNGAAKVFLKDSGGAGDTYLVTDIDFGVSGSLTTDNGLTFGASIDLDDTDNGELGSEDSNGVVEDAEIFVSGSFGTITFGDLPNAADAIGLPDIGVDGIGADDDIEGLRKVGNNSDIRWTYAVDAFNVAITYGIGDTASADSQEGDFGIVLGYAANGFSGQIGYVKDDTAPGSDATAIKVGYAANGLAGELMYVDGASTDGLGYHLAYTMDNLTVRLVGSSIDGAANDDLGLGIEYGLGGGATFAAGFGEINGETAYEIGVKMKF